MPPPRPPTHHPKSPHLDPPPRRPSQPPPPRTSLNPPPPMPSPPPPPPPWGPSAHFYWGGSRVQKRGDTPPPWCNPAAVGNKDGLWTGSDDPHQTRIMGGRCTPHVDRPIQTNHCCSSVPLGAGLVVGVKGRPLFTRPMAVWYHWERLQPCNAERWTQQQQSLVAEAYST